MRTAEEVKANYIDYIKEDVTKIIILDDIDKTYYHTLYINAYVLIALDETTETAIFLQGLLYPIWGILEAYENESGTFDKLTELIDDMAM